MTVSGCSSTDSPVRPQRTLNDVAVCRTFQTSQCGDKVVGIPAEVQHCNVNPLPWFGLHSPGGSRCPTAIFLCGVAGQSDGTRGWSHFDRGGTVLGAT